MKRWIRKIMILFAVITGVLSAPVICHAGDNEKMVPIYGEDVKDGTYSIEVKSSSSMFRVVDAKLNVADGNMTAVLTLSGKGYLKLYMGTGEQALAAKEEDYIPFVENAEGAYTYTIPVEVLNQEFECTAYSKRKEKWYDRQLVFQAQTLPQDALLKPLVPAYFDKKDGNYTIEASLTGGSGRVEILSPMPITITENIGMASLQWDSPYYDYMIVNGEKIYPVNTDEYSLFEIPVWLLDQEMLVIADTTAMSVPHEIKYGLTFHSDTLKGQGSVAIIVGCIVALLVCSVTVYTVFMMKRNKKKLLFCALVLSTCMFLIIGCGKTEAQNYGQIVIENLKERDLDISPQLSYINSTELRYAEQFAVDYYNDGYTLFSLADGSRMLLVPEGSEAPAELDGDITVLKQPIDNLYLVATAAMDMFCELDALEKIRFSGQKIDGWYIEEARDAMEAGDILYAGKYSMPDYELIVSEGCSLAIENTMISHSPEVSEKLKEFGIPVMIDYSSYEKHPLGRVEWVKFYGALLGKEEKAMEAFQMQEDILERVSKEEGTGKTVAFFYIASNGTVNVRKTSDYIPQMIALAGGKYIFENLGSDTDNKLSINLSMEEFYAAAKESDYLIYNSFLVSEMQTVEELLDKSEMLKDFKAVREGNVWCTTSDLYQQSMSVGYFIEDVHRMLSEGIDGEEKMRYIYYLE